MFKIFWVSADGEQKNEDLKIEMIHKKEELEEEEVWQVALDILEDDDNIFIIAPIAWVEQADIDLSLNKTVLTIQWNRQKSSEYFLEWVKIKNSECFWWKFTRNIILPENLALNKIKAYMQLNLLIITIPKLRFDTKNIKINKMEWKM
jgi:HSP20 family molecular chaperone IbpA